MRITKRKLKNLVIKRLYERIEKNGISQNQMDTELLIAILKKTR